MPKINGSILLAFFLFLFLFKPVFSADVPESIFSDAIFSDPIKFYRDDLNHHFPALFLTPAQRVMVDRYRKNRLGVKIKSESHGYGKPATRKYRIVGFAEVGAGKFFVAMDGIGLVSLSRIFGKHKLTVNKIGYRTLSVLINGVRKELSVGDRVALKM